MNSIGVGRKKGCAGEATASWRLEIDPWLVARKRTSVQITTVVRLSQNGYGPAAAGCKLPSMLRAVVSKCSEKPAPAWCSRTELWLDKVPAETAICSKKAS